MLHGLAARTHRACSNAARPCSMDTRAVQHCYTVLQHGHAGCAALLHGLAARTREVCSIAARPCSMDSQPASTPAGETCLGAGRARRDAAGAAGETPAATTAPAACAFHRHNGPA